ncbi:MAG: oxidoreductase [Pseudonocardia sp. SCN 72-86]|nr:MAG: oxidoreductase [Pseudonocardia sp. SCN 72-86]
MGLLDGKVALVTGAARGQGRAHALTYAREGADVVVLDICDQVETSPYPTASRDDLDETVKLVKDAGRRVLAITADVRSQEQLDAALARTREEFGRIDVVTANAGIWNTAPFWEMPEQQWAEMVDINLSGVWRTAKAVAPTMIEQGSGSIVVTASVNALEPGPNFAHYVAAKHGAIGLMKNIALELAPHGVRCNAVCPGAIDTPMTHWQGAYDIFHGGPGGTIADQRASGYHFHALREAGMLDPSVIANAALWLHSDLAAYVTGVAVPVDAGHMLIGGVNKNPIGL